MQSSRRARPKPQLSCNLCKRKKLRCDRGRPCSQCVRTDNQCTYPGSALDSASSASRHAIPTGIEDRVNVLEQTLRHLVASTEPGSQRATPALPRANTESEDGPHTVSGPRLSTDAESPYYVHPANWEGILQDIDGIRDDLEAATLSSVPESLILHRNTPHLLFNLEHDGSAKHSLQLSLPTINKLLDIFVEHNQIATTLVVIHMPTFRKEVEQYLENSSDADHGWKAILNAMLSIATNIAFGTGSKLDDLQDMDKMSYAFMQQAAHHLRESRYTNPTKHTLTAMVLYLASEHPWARDGAVGASMILSIMVRIAYRMGYHLDPAIYGVSVFDAEMRRRVWLAIIQLDCLFAIRTGLPRIVDERRCDTGSPRNLLDGDLDPHMHVLPSARPTSEPSPIAFLNLKIRLLRLQGQILDGVPNHATAIGLEEALMSEFRNKPIWLQTLDSHSSHTPSTFIFSSMVETDLIFQSARMTLHRRYLLLAYEDSTYNFSRQSCLAAAEQTIRLQSLLRQDFQRSQGSQERTDRNWRLMALNSHSFLTAAMLICLDLDHITASGGIAGMSASALRNECQRLIGILEQARAMWEILKQCHPEASQVTAVLDVLLQRFNARRSTAAQAAAGREGLPVGTGGGMVAGPGNTHHNMPWWPPSAPGIIGQQTTPHMEPSFPGGTMQAHGIAFGSYAGVDENDAQIQNMLDESHIDVDWSRWNMDWGTDWNPMDFDF